MADTSTTLRRRWPRPTLTTAIFAVVVGGTALAGYAAFCVVHNVVTVVVPECYAEEWVAELVIEYMKANDGRWPSSWEDLSVPYEKLSMRQEIPWTLVELHGRVEIRFDVDPEDLRTAAAVEDRLPFKVIYLRSGGAHHWEYGEPNRMIWDHLNQPEPIAEDPPAPPPAPP